MKLNLEKSVVVYKSTPKPVHKETPDSNPSIFKRITQKVKDKIQLKKIQNPKQEQPKITGMPYNSPEYRNLETIYKRFSHLVSEFRFYIDKERFFTTFNLDTFLRNGEMINVSDKHSHSCNKSIMLFGNLKCA